MQEFLSLPNTDFDNYIFTTHLYQFEYKDAEPEVSVAMQCPTVSFPRLFLRIPTPSDQYVKVVVVPEQKQSSQPYTYTLANAKSMTIGKFLLKIRIAKGKMHSKGVVLERGRIFFTVASFSILRQLSHFSAKK